VPALADLSLGAGDLLAVEVDVEVDVEVVSVEAFVAAVLAGGLSPACVAGGGVVGRDDRAG